jgi:integrase
MTFYMVRSTPIWPVFVSLSDATNPSLARVRPPLYDVIRLFSVYSASIQGVKMRLTASAVEKAALPPAGQREYFIRDDKVEGFALRVTAKGVRSFLWEGRIKGRPRRHTIGRWPDWTVALARQRAMEIRTAIARGEDPHEERQGKRNEAKLRELIEDWLSNYAKLRRRSWKRDETRLKKHLESGLLNRRLSDISGSDIARLHEAVGAAAGPVEANRLAELLRAIFAWAAERGYALDGNPARTGKHSPVRLFKERPRKRFLSIEELRRVKEVLLEEPDWRWKAYFFLILMLATRRTELLSARWDSVDLESRMLRLPHTKSGEPHLLPLPTFAVEILRSLPSRQTSEFIFPGDGATGHLVEPKKAWAKIRTRAGCLDVTLHDLRRTGGAMLAGAGYGLPVIGRVLNHASPAATAIYARLDLDPVREALESHARLVALGAPTNVEKDSNSSNSNR